MIHRKRGLLYPLLPSRSYADARIEMHKCKHAAPIITIAFLCGRADWNIMTVIIQILKMIAFLCGRADWNKVRKGFWSKVNNRVPMRTRGLKYFNLPLSLKTAHRVPMRTRGLKSCRRSEGRFGLMSCSLRSAWIEIGWAWAARWSSVALLAERVD